MTLPPTESLLRILVLIGIVLGCLFIVFAILGLIERLVG